MRLLALVLSMSLPKWIEDCRLHDSCNLVDALEIAWEALEYGFNGRTIKEPGMSVQARPLSKSEIQLSLEKAMRRIATLGDIRQNGSLGSQEKDSMEEDHYHCNDPKCPGC